MARQRSSILAAIAICFGSCLAHGVPCDAANHATASTVAAVDYRWWRTASHIERRQVIVASVAGIQVGWTAGSAGVHGSVERILLDPPNGLKLSSDLMSKIVRTRIDDNPPAFSKPADEYEREITAVYLKTRNARAGADVATILIGCLADRPVGHCEFSLPLGEPAVVRSKGGKEHPIF